MVLKTKVELKGQDKVLKHLKQVTNPDKLFDKALQETANNSIAKLIKGSLTKNPRIRNMQTGNTSRAWTKPKQVGGGKYQVTNDYKSRDGKWNVARLINDGHGEIRPKKKFLYIPLNKSAAQKRPGANIPSNLKQGEDFVFAKKVKAKKGSKFIDKDIAASSKELTRRVIKAIRGVYN